MPRDGAGAGAAGGTAAARVPSAFGFTAFLGALACFGAAASFFAVGFFADFLPDFLLDFLAAFFAVFFAIGFLALFLTLFLADFFVFFATRLVFVTRFLAAFPVARAGGDI